MAGVRWVLDPDAPWTDHLILGALSGALWFIAMVVMSRRQRGDLASKRAGLWCLNVAFVPGTVGALVLLIVDDEGAEFMWPIVIIGVLLSAAVITLLVKDIRQT